MANQAQFIGSVRCTLSKTTTRNFNTDGSGPMTIAYTAGVNGSRVERIALHNTEYNEACTVNVFISNDSSPNTSMNTVLYKTIVFKGNDDGRDLSDQPLNSATVEEFSDQGRFPILLAAGQTIRVSTTGNAIFSIVVMGGDY